MNKIRTAVIAVVAGTALLGAACSSDDDSASDTSTTETTAESTTTTMADSSATESQSIAEIASSNPDLSTLVSLVTSAGLAETLAGPGTFTVFAPTNEAFAKVPKETLDALAADPGGALKQVLTLHVLPTEVDAAGATAAVGQCVDTVNGGKLAVAQQGEDLTIGGAKVVKTDIQANNGVIHVIDSVITEPSAGC